MAEKMLPQEKKKKEKEQKKESCLGEQHNESQLYK